ncbi:putative ATP-dependent helicase YwqA [Neochlamydia sp. TUME1]|uniref:DEAD/DEAH box helicase n=1 Tax=Neochlamydia sp. TUME1 TaxID=1478174 RepID=UPI0005835543|nr:DEAD/DEAH box helicase [Neochlamydia sp. TUME1]KIC76865.1 putative ATP-dependent helicase YwqA [Neochlamydia sp. TUME1]
MPEIAYSIDQSASEKEGLLAVALLEIQHEGFNITLRSFNSPATTTRWSQWATSKDKDPQRILTLRDAKLENGYLKIPYSQSIQALKLLAASGKLFYKGKKLICDFFTPVEFYYRIHDQKAQGMLKYLDQEFNLSACDFICRGSNHWFIKGNILKLIHTEITWKELKQIYQEPLEFSLSCLLESRKTVDADVESLARIVYTDNKQEHDQQAQQPLPLLTLKDRSGAFADLWMDYGEDKQWPFHDKNINAHKRDIGAEKNWEKDLLETGFIQKLVGHSHYYCPLDQVAKSLTFLLEIGWHIKDYQRKKVYLLTQSHLDISMEGKEIITRGTFHFDTYQAPLQEVAGAFNKSERFVQIGEEAIGLLPEKWELEGVPTLFREGEIVTEGIRLKKHQLRVLEDLFHASSHLSLDAAISKLKTELQTLAELPSINPSPLFQGSLRPYQQQGLNWLNFLKHYGFNGMLSDDMGLGKTVQVLAFLSQLEHSRPVLIIMPTSLIFNWQREIERFLPHKKIILHHGPLRALTEDDLTSDAIILTSYPTMRLDLALLAPIEFAALILDEAQAIKNSLTQVAKAAYQLQGDFRLLLTGTPIENHLGEIWSHFHFLMPELLGEEKDFCAGLKASQSDSRYLQNIKKKIHPFVLRRKKAEVAKDLPACIEQTVWVEMPPSQRKIYDSYLAGIKSHLFTKINIEGLSKHRLEVFEAILRLRQICCHPLLISSQLTEDGQLECTSGKMEAFLQDVSNAIAENDKVLIYSQFTSMLHLIAREFKARQWSFVYLDGLTKDREKVVNQFQDNADIPLFLISLKAGGTGLNLTKADHVMIFDPWWNEAAEKQAINRAHRIGRNTPVFAKRYVTIETIEEKIMRLKEQKKSMIDTLFEEDGSFAQLTLQDLTYLLN